MGLVAPLALALILGGTIGGADDPEAFKLGVAVEDDGAVADGFLVARAALEEEEVIELTAARGRADLERFGGRRFGGSGFSHRPGIQ